MNPFTQPPIPGVAGSPLGWPTIRCNLPDWEQMMDWVKACRVEVNGFGYVDYDPATHSLWLHHPFLVDQTASLAGVETDAKAYAKFQDEAVRAGFSLENLRLQWHSHVDGPVVFSKIDTDNMARWPGELLVSVVFNKRGEYCCRLDVKRPLPLSVELPVQINLPGPTPERLRQAHADIKAFVKDVTPKPILRPMGKPAPARSAARGATPNGNGSEPAPARQSALRSFASWLMGVPDEQTSLGEIPAEKVQTVRSPKEKVVYTTKPKEGRRG